MVLFPCMVHKRCRIFLKIHFSFSLYCGAYLLSLLTHAVYGSEPSFVFCTATSGNPREHAMVRSYTPYWYHSKLVQSISNLVTLVSFDIH